MEKSPKLNWVDSLKKYIQSHPQRSVQEIDDETDVLFLKYIEEDKKKQAEEDPSLNKIPRFF